MRFNAHAQVQVTKNLVVCRSLGVALHIFIDIQIRQFINLTSRYLTFAAKMAEEALKKLEQQLNCSICLDTYTNPKLLQCFHVYCQQCLVTLVDRDQQGLLGLSCPICRQLTPVPNRGVAGLQSAFHINHLLELRDSFQNLDNPVLALERAVGGTTNDAPSREAV